MANTVDRPEARKRFKAMIEDPETGQSYTLCRDGRWRAFFFDTVGGRYPRTYKTAKNAIRACYRYSGKRADWIFIGDYI